MNAITIKTSTVRSDEFNPLKIAPLELQDINHWVLEINKQPFDQNGNTTGWNDPESGFWMSFWDAIALWKKYPEKYDCVGFIAYADPDRDDEQFVFVDLDNCVDPYTGEPTAWGREIVELLRDWGCPTYHSFTKTGFRAVFKGRVPGDASILTGRHGPQDVPDEIKEHIMEVKPSLKEKKGVVWNGLELFEHNKNVTFCHPLLPGFSETVPILSKEQIDKLVSSTIPDHNSKKGGRKKPSSGRKNVKGSEHSRWVQVGSLPRLKMCKVMDVRNDSGWHFNGEEWNGPHPIEDSSTGHNTWINYEDDVWSYFHMWDGGSAPGGDGWLWLACEIGIIDWMEAGPGLLEDADVIKVLKEEAARRGYFTRSKLGLTPTLEEAKETVEMLIKKSEDDPGAAFEEENLRALAVLKARNLAEFQRARASLKKYKVSMSALMPLVEQRSAELQTEADVSISPEILVEAEEILREADKKLDDGTAFEYILTVWQDRHYGDENLGKALFLSIGAQSCVSSKGIHVHACGPRGMGKSDGTEKAADAIPSRYLLVGSASPKALYYLGEDLPAGSIVYLDDIGWSDQAAQMFKTCTTFYQNGAKHTVVIDQEITHFRTAPRIAFWLTTADAQTDEQVRDRLLRIDITEDLKHKQQVVGFIFEGRKGGVASFDTREIDICRGIIFLLKQVFVDVVIPFADHIKFEGDPRGATIFVDLVSAYAIWRHRIRGRDENGAIIATVQDYKDAEKFFNSIKGHSDSKYTPGELRVLQAIKDLGGNASTEQILKKTGLSKGRLSEIINGRNRDGQSKYGLMHKCPALSDEIISIHDEGAGTTRREKRYHLSNDFDILGAYGVLVNLNGENAITERSSSGLDGFAPSLGYGIGINRGLVRQFVDNENIRERYNITNKSKNPTPLLGAFNENNSSLSQTSETYELTNSQSHDIDNALRTDGELGRTHQTDFIRDDALSGLANVAEFLKNELIQTAIKNSEVNYPWEKEIIWRRDPTDYRLLREERGSTGRPYVGDDDGHIIVGYTVNYTRDELIEIRAEIDKKDRRMSYKFWAADEWRLWYVRPSDLPGDPNYAINRAGIDYTPIEAVIPSSVRVGKMSVKFPEVGCNSGYEPEPDPCCSVCGKDIENRGRIIENGRYYCVEHGEPRNKDILVTAMFLRDCFAGLDVGKSPFSDLARYGPRDYLKGEIVGDVPLEKVWKHVVDGSAEIVIKSSQPTRCATA